MAKRVKFTEDGARRIVAATRAFERGNRDQPPIKFRSTGGDDGDPVRVGQVTTAWARGTCTSVVIWEQQGSDCEPVENDPPVVIDDVANLSHDVAAHSWVLIVKAANGRWYLLEAGLSGECRTTIGGEDLTTLPDYDGAASQVLGHGPDGCLKWFDTTTCG